MEFILNRVIFIILEGAILLFLLLYLLGKLEFWRTDTLKAAAYIALYYILSIFLFNYRGLPITFFYIVFSILIFSYLTRTNLYLSIAVNIIVFLIYGITEMISSIIVLYFMGVPFTTAMGDDFTQMKALIFIRPIQTAMIYIATRFRVNLNYLQKSFSPKDTSSTSFLLLILFFMSVFYSNGTKYINDLGVLLSSGLMFLSVILLGILDTRERIKLINIENQLKLQQEYSRNMELIVDAVRKEKHDYKNHISTLVALCTMNEPEVLSRVKAYALKLTENINSSGFHFYNTGNKYLDGLLAVKNNIAADSDIIFEVDTETTLDSMNISVDDVDLTTIVGNIVDNAFDAVMTNPEDRKKIVSLSIYEEDGKCYISVSNNGPEIPDVHKKHIFEYKYSTKAKSSGERGYGLYIVRELILKNHGEITFRTNEFETEFLISFKCASNNSLQSSAGA